MGNIKHNDELLRVHDDGFDVVFNCDNKHQNGVSYHAEKNGKKTKIDPEYAMAALVKKISAGGGDSPTDEILENAKETGGIGYTENGEQTVITWDGDTEGRDVLTVINSAHPDVVVVRMYKVAEYSSKEFTENCELFAAGSQQPVSLYTYDHAETYDGDVPLAIRTDGTDFDIQNVGTVHAESSGVYFVEMGGAYVESLTYGTPDTIHKIDEKYLPESGVTVVAFELDSHENVTGSLSPEQVKNAMLTSIVIGTRSVNGADPVPIGPAFYDPLEDSVSFGLYYGSGGLKGLIISNAFGWNAG